MEAGELRIGNWVSFDMNDPWDEDEPEQGYLDIQVKVSDIEDPSRLFPIPLTEDWLLRMGFEKISQDCFRHTDNDEYKTTFTILYDAGLKLFKVAFQHFWYSISVVNQLQNLYFALTGEELKVSPP